MSFGKGTICADYVQHYDQSLYAPEDDVSSRSGEVQAAYSEYRLSIDLLIQAAAPIVNSCRPALAENQTAQRVFGSIEAGTGRSNLSIIQRHINNGINIMYGVVGE